MPSPGHKSPRTPSPSGPRLVGPPSLGRRLMRWALRLFIAGVLVGTAVVLGGYWYFSRGLPDFESVTDYRPPQLSRVFAADGTVLAEFGQERRTVVRREQMAEVLRQAVLAAEDADFYKHEGLDYMGMARALYNSMRAGRVTGSGSTITQQTVKNLVLSQEKSFSRKAKEIILTKRLEERLTKDEILEIYLNTIYLGHGRYGVQEACRYYFGKDAGDVTLNEAALLAGIIQSPERHSPRKHYDSAVNRRAYVLDQMAKNGFITPEQADEVSRSPLALAEPPVERVDDAMWFVNLVKRQLTERLGEQVLYEGGLRVHTTLDPVRQARAQEALRQGLKGIDARQKFAKPLEKVADNQVETWRAKRRAALSDRPPPEERAAPARIQAITPKGLVVDFGVGTALIELRNAERFADAEGTLPFHVGEVYEAAIRADGPKHPERMKAAFAFAPQGAVVVLDPRDRSVLALVGGYSYADYPYDRATQARRQPGSAFKPFVFGAALESRKYTPATVMLDAPETYQMTPGKWWKPKNYDGEFIGDVNIRTALAKSINSVAIKMTDDIGISAVQSFARRAGITSPLADNLTVALGSSEVSPLELTNAFATLAIDGRPGAPRFIREVTGPAGPIDIEPSQDTEDAPEQTIGPETTWLLRSLMRSVVTAGSGTRLNGVPRKVVGKTGTSNDARDTWFVGMLPDVVITAWVGFDSPQSLGRKETGGSTAAPIVRTYLDTMERKGAEWSPAPAGIETAEVDPITGLRATDETPNKYLEYFLRGTVPSETAPNQGEVDATDFMMQQLGLGAEVPAGEDAPEVAVSPLPGQLAPDELQPLPRQPVAAPDINVGEDAPALDPDVNVGDVPRDSPRDSPRPTDPSLAPLAPIKARPAEAAPIRVPTIPVVPLPEEGIPAEEVEVEDEDRPE